jgi:hypothetical protein
MSSKEIKVSGSPGFAGLLTLLLIGLKLGNVIDWSWWWVLSPLLISGGLAVAIVVVALLVSR